MSNYKKKRLIFVGSIFVISLIALILIVTNFRDNIVFFYSPSELHQNLGKTKGKTIRIGGLVVKGSVEKIDALTTKFKVSDLKEELLVEHRGIVPDLFREEQGIVARGVFDAKKNIFLSQELLIKHDENYMPPEVKESLHK